MADPDEIAAQVDALRDEVRGDGTDSGGVGERPDGLIEVHSTPRGEGLYDPSKSLPFRRTLDENGVSDLGFLYRYASPLAARSLSAVIASQHTDHPEAVGANGLDDDLGIGHPETRAEVSVFDLQMEYPEGADADDGLTNGDLEYMNATWAGLAYTEDSVATARERIDYWTTQGVAPSDMWHPEAGLSPDDGLPGDETASLDGPADETREERRQRFLDEIGPTPSERTVLFQRNRTHDGLYDPSEAERAGEYPGDARCPHCRAVAASDSPEVEGKPEWRNGPPDILEFKEG